MMGNGEHAYSACRESRSETACMHPSWTVTSTHTCCMTGSAAMHALAADSSFTTKGRYMGHTYTPAGLTNKLKAGTHHHDYQCAAVAALGLAGARASLASVLCRRASRTMRARSEMWLPIVSSCARVGSEGAASALQRLYSPSMDRHTCMHHLR